MVGCNLSLDLVDDYLCLFLLQGGHNKYERFEEGGRALKHHYKEMLDWILCKNW